MHNYVAFNSINFNRYLHLLLKHFVNISILNNAVDAHSRVLSHCFAMFGNILIMDALCVKETG